MVLKHHVLWPLGEFKESPTKSKESQRRHPARAPRLHECDLNRGTGHWAWVYLDGARRGWQPYQGTSKSGSPPSRPSVFLSDTAALGQARRPSRTRGPPAPGCGSSPLPHVQDAPSPSESQGRAGHGEADLRVWTRAHLPFHTPKGNCAAQNAPEEGEERKAANQRETQGRADGVTVPNENVGFPALQFPSASSNFLKPPLSTSARQRHR